MGEGFVWPFPILLNPKMHSVLKVISIGVEKKKVLKRRRHDVLVLKFWLSALEFEKLKFIFFVAFIFSSAIFPDFKGF